MDIIFEIESPHTQPYIVRSNIQDGDYILIGRAYDNDIILHDPHISPHHGRVYVDKDGFWWYEDLESINGSYSNNNQRIQQCVQIFSGDVISVGNLHIRFFSKEHTVADAIPSQRLSLMFQYLLRPQWLMLLVGVGMLFYLFNNWLALTSPRKLSEWVYEVIPYFIILFIWACFWALMGKVARRESRFSHQLTIAALLQIAFIISAFLINILNFNVGNVAVEELSWIISLTVIAGTSLWISIKLATDATQGRWQWLSYGSVCLIAILVIWLPTQMEANSQIPNYVSDVAPPSLLFRESKSIDAFVSESGSIFSHEPSTP